MIIKSAATIVYLFIFIFAFGDHAPDSAQEAYNQTYVTSEIISEISYSEVDNTYYIYTDEDDSGRFWVVDYKDADISLERLNNGILGRQMDIHYWIDNEADGAAEIGHLVIY